MKSLPTPALVASLAVFLLAAGATLQSARAAETPPTQLAVINIVQVFSEIDEKKDGDSEIEKLSNEINAERKKKEDQITKLNDSIKPGSSIFLPNSPEYKKIQDDLLEATMNYQAFLSVSEQRLLMMQRMKTADLYRKINMAVEKYAKVKGIAIVFVIDDIDVNAKDMRELTSKIAMRKILYAHPSFDITKDIKEAMNAEYRLGAKAP